MQRFFVVRWLFNLAVLFVSLYLSSESRLSAQLVPGIDVSHYQGSINWASVAGGGNKFAFMKATEATSYVDPTFATNQTNAVANGVLAGFYHFCSVSTDTTTDPVNEANHFLASIKPVYLTGQYLPPVADVESFPTGLTTAQYQATTSAWVQKFSDTVYNSLGVRPIVYTSLSKANSYYTSAVASSHLLWLAQWKGTGTTSPPTSSSTPLWGKFDFWQWSDGSDSIAKASPVPGISGGVDRDVYGGTLDALKLLLLGKDKSKPGDFNRDGLVNQADYNMWVANSGKTVPIYTGADGNGDARVNSADLDIWLRAVPEPTSVVLGIFATVAGGFLTRRRFS